jgi:hypothetical protein
VFARAVRATSYFHSTEPGTGRAVERVEPISAADAQRLFGAAKRAKMQLRDDGMYVFVVGSPIGYTRVEIEVRQPQGDEGEWTEIDEEYAGTVQSLIDDGYTREEARASAEDNIRETYGDEVLLWKPRHQRRRRESSGARRKSAAQLDADIAEVLANGEGR